MLKDNRILIVDDNETIHQDIKAVLDNSSKSQDPESLNLESELFGNDDSEDTEKVELVEYVIDDAYQGEEGVRMVDEAWRESCPYSLVFMDVRMPPGIDGVQTIKRIWEKYPNIEMVICTAFSDYSWDKMVASLGRTEKLFFMKKPFDPTALKQITLTLTTKWQLQQKSMHYVKNLEKEVVERTEQLDNLLDELRQLQEKAQLTRRRYSGLS